MRQDRPNLSFFHRSTSHCGILYGGTARPILRPPHRRLCLSQRKPCTSVVSPSGCSLRCRPRSRCIPCPRRSRRRGPPLRLVVGVQNYEGTGLGSLRYCDNDAAGLAEVLGRRGYRVILMTRPEYKAKDRDDLLPTADNIRDNLKAILLNRKPTDTVLLAFSGHGEQLKKDGKMYFCAAKCNLDKPETLVAWTRCTPCSRTTRRGARC